ncbi:Internalin-A precursor [Lignipirellula cremea]|uniref:Internalin-A n=1 Tax=Lignipirellula cremea TaxID=2528010 RepID=A0A518DRB9_9BACT|nr:Internalin-A precursor [Lignipirellula cremea]
MPTKDPWWVQPWDLKAMAAVREDFLAQKIPALKLPAEAGDDEVRFLADIPTLKWLDLTSTQVTDEGLAALANLTGLETLILANTQVGDEGVAHLANLVGLKSLDITGTPVGDAGIAHLGKLKQLEKLFAWGTSITGKRLALIAEHRELVELNIGSDYINEEEVAPLANLVRLEDLELRPIPLTDAWHSRCPIGHLRCLPAASGLFSCQSCFARTRNASRSPSMTDCLGMTCAINDAT